MEKKTVYLETSVVSYLTNRPSRDLVVAAHQTVTREWWEKRRDDFTLYVSELVLDEAGSGDPQAAAERFDAIASACLESGYKPPIICTPDELTGD